MVSGAADWEDQQPESHKIQVTEIICQSLAAPWKSNISLSLNILEKGGFGSVEYSRVPFSAVFRPSHVPRQKYLGNLIDEFG